MNSDKNKYRYVSKRKSTSENKLTEVKHPCKRKTSSENKPDYSDRNKYRYVSDRKPTSKIEDAYKKKTSSENKSAKNIDDFKCENILEYSILTENGSKIFKSKETSEGNSSGKQHYNQEITKKLEIKPVSAAKIKSVKELVVQNKDSCKAYSHKVIKMKQSRAVKAVGSKLFFNEKLSCDKQILTNAENVNIGEVCISLELDECSKPI